MYSETLIVVFADDDLDDLEILRDGLNQIAPNHTLHYVNDGEQVLPVTRTFKPHIIFLDFNMPACDGSECLRLLKKDNQLKEIPVVMYSTSSADFSLLECYNLGAARYLLKPVNYSGIFKGLEVIFDLYQKGLLVTPSFEKFMIDTYKMK